MTDPFLELMLFSNVKNILGRPYLSPFPSAFFLQKETDEGPAEEDKDGQARCQRGRSL